MPHFGDLHITIWIQIVVHNALNLGMTLELSSGQLLVLFVPNIMLFVSFVIYVRVELSVLKARLVATEKQAQEDKKTHEKESDEIKNIYRDLSARMENMQTMYGKQLFEINTKVTQVATWVDIKGKD